MMEFILSLNEFTVSALTIILLTLLTAIYRLNIRLAQYAIVGKKWEVTDKINKLGKRMVMFGGLATLPLVIILISTINIDSEIFRNIVIACYAAWLAGYFALLASVPLLILALVWRVHLSNLSMATVLMAFFITIKNTLQPHWRTIALSVSAVALFVILWPVLQSLLYLGVLVLLAKAGPLFKNEKEEYEYDSGGSYYNYLTGKLGYSYEPGSSFEDYEE